MVVVADGLALMIHQPCPAAGIESSLEQPGGVTANDSSG